MYHHPIYFCMSAHVAQAWVPGQCMHERPINSDLSTHFAHAGAPTLRTRGCPVCPPPGTALITRSRFRQGREPQHGVMCRLPQTGMRGDLRGPREGATASPWGKYMSQNRRCPTWVGDAGPVTRGLAVQPTTWQSCSGDGEGEAALCLEIINPGLPDEVVVSAAPRDQGAVVATRVRGDMRGLDGDPAGCCAGTVLAEPLGARARRTDVCRGRGPRGPG